MLNEDEYIKLLDRAFEQAPSLSSEKSDFEIPKVDSIVQGNKTIIRNLSQIADKARRSPGDIAKYLSKEFGVPVGIEDQRLVLNGKFSNDDIEKRMHRYFDVYVICRECGKPDTHLEGAGRGMFFMVCEACGARYGIKNY
ncbi:MAG: translation initiation factor IF-2 subunit beta [Candidatus Marsarchaeota archaeon]|nr:translation initiation factor IF-2 subunit beta [Candidatus Marsarchaeota archaeon]